MAPANLATKSSSPTDLRAGQGHKFDALDQALVDIVEGDSPMTVRQTFYQAEVAGLVPKDEDGYKLVLARLVVVRERFITVAKGPSLDPDLIIDPSRKIDRVPTWADLPRFLDTVKNWYRRDLWRDQRGALPIILIEKEALAGIVRSVTDDYAVPLIATHGSPSITVMKDLANFIGERHVAIYQFGDHDPMGENIPRQCEKALRLFGLGLGQVIREALTPEQVARWKLPSRPTKASGAGDHLGRAFKAEYGDSVELDALTTTRLRELVENAITRHVDQAAWTKSLKRQASDQRRLEKLIKVAAS